VVFSWRRLWVPFFPKEKNPKRFRKNGEFFADLQTAARYRGKGLPFFHRGAVKCFS